MLEPTLRRWSLLALALLSAPAVAQERTPVETKRQETPAPQKEPKPAPGGLSGRILLSDGLPAFGASVKVHAWQSNSERVLRYGLPENWTDPSGVTDAEGRFHLSFDPPQAYQFVLEVTAPGHCKASWRWGELEPGRVHDVGEVQLERGGTVILRVVTPDGQVLNQGWRVYADNARGSVWNGRDSTRVFGNIDPATGEARLEHVPAGKVTIKAHSPIANWIQGEPIEVRVGETVRADIVYAGPDNADRIVVIPFSRPFYIFESDVEPIFATGPDGLRRKAERIPGSSQSMAFDDLPPGDYLVEIEDPRFLPWSRAGVAPGERVKAFLEGSASIRLSVTDASNGEPIEGDASSGEPVEGYGLLVRYERSNSSPSRFQVLAEGAGPPEFGLFEGIVPGRIALQVTAPGYPPVERSIGELRPGEERAVSIELRGGRTVEGTVFDAGGVRPAAGLTVKLATLAPNGKVRRTSNADEVQLGSLETVTDMGGAFRFENASPGTVQLSVQRNRFIGTRLQLEERGESEAGPVKLVLPPTSELRGRVLAPESAEGQTGPTKRLSLRGMSLVLLPAAKPFQEDIFSAQQALSFELEEDGSFVALHLPPGRSEIQLQGPSIDFPGGHGLNFDLPAPAVPIGEVDLGAHVTLEREFDVAASWPGRIAVEVLTSGRPLPGLRVVAEKGRDQVQDVLDENGRVLLPFVPSGEWRITVSPMDGDWSHTVDGVHVPTNGLVERRIELQIVSGVLRILDAESGEPLPGHRIRMQREGSRQSTTIRTDAQGELQLGLAIGRYVVRDGESFWSPGDSKASTFDWTIGGPVPTEVRIQRQ